MDEGIIERFEEFLEVLGAQNAIDFVRELNELYLQSGRFYHNLEHIDNCLAEFDEIKELLDDPKAVEFAIWYHDAIYDAKAKDNELKSAELAAGVCNALGLSSDFSSKVFDLILSTKHDFVPIDFDAKFMVDIDLSIFGQDADKFGKYEQGIRNEYALVEPEAFNVGRSAVLIKFLGRPAIYLTEKFSQKYEAKARENLNESLKKLFD